MIELPGVIRRFLIITVLLLYGCKLDFLPTKSNQNDEKNTILFTVDSISGYAVNDYKDLVSTEYPEYTFPLAFKVSDDETDSINQPCEVKLYNLGWNDLIEVPRDIFITENFSIIDAEQKLDSNLLFMSFTFDSIGVNLLSGAFYISSKLDDVAPSFFIATTNS